MVKYIVELGYNNTYEFAAPATAVNFAELALEHRVERESYTRITLQVVDEEEAMFSDTNGYTVDIPEVGSRPNDVRESRAPHRE